MTERCCHRCHVWQDHSGYHTPNERTCKRCVSLATLRTKGIAPKVELRKSYTELLTSPDVSDRMIAYQMMALGVPL